MAHEPIKTILSVTVLQQILDLHGWTQNELADKSKIHRATVSMHLAGKRPIRDEHLITYLNALDRHERQMLLAAWIRDTLSAEAVADVLDLHKTRVAEEVREWGPKLNHEQQQMLSWWATQLSRDPELDGIFRSITRKLGYSK